MAGNTATINVSAFRADWAAHIPMRALCVRWTITRDQVIRLKHVWHLPPRHDRRLRAKPVRQPDPTPDEIAAYCREIQMGWDDQTREDRCMFKTQHVHMRRIELTDEARDALGDFPDE